MGVQLSSTSLALDVVNKVGLGRGKAAQGLGAGEALQDRGGVTWAREGQVAGLALWQSKGSRAKRRAKGRAKGRQNRSGPSGPLVLGQGSRARGRAKGRAKARQNRSGPSETLVLGQGKRSRAKGRGKSGQGPRDSPYSSYT